MKKKTCFAGCKRHNIFRLVGPVESYNFVFLFRKVNPKFKVKSVFKQNDYLFQTSYIFQTIYFL